MIGAVVSREDWQRRLGPLYGGAVALVHSTPWRWPDTIGHEARSPGWIVALGLPIGVVAYVAAALIKGIGFPAWVAAIVGLAALTLASAALVEKGVAERIDRHESQAPSVTTILVLVFVTLVRAGAIVAVAPERWLGVFVATAVIGRWAAVFLQALGDPILDDDAPRSLVASPAPAWLVGALSLGTLAIVVLGLGGKAGIAVLALGAAAAFGLGLDAQRRERGLTSPVVACAAAIAEMLALLVATLH